MSFKLHLIIVSCIIVAVSLAWQLMSNTSSPPPSGNDAATAHIIAITHASLGLNCRNLVINNESTPHDAFANTGKGNSKLREDNVFAPVSLMCNGKQQCDVAIDDPALGDDPAPECRPKTLEIEYRCFSYDRPWIVKSAAGVLSLHCDTPSK